MFIDVIFVTSLRFANKSNKMYMNEWINKEIKVSKCDTIQQTKTVMREVFVKFVRS